MPRPVDEDATVRLPRPRALGPRKPWRPPIWAMVAAPLSLLAATAVVWLIWPSPQPPAPPRLNASAVAAARPPAAAPIAPSTSVALAPPRVVPPATPEVAPTPPATIPIETATERQILDHVPPAGAPDPTVFRFQPNPRILVLDFASLRDQGLMLDRVAALAEKSGLPHDRVLTSSELDAAVRASGDTIETYYYGHDYGVQELARFFALGDREDVRFVAQEDVLRRLLAQDGWFEPNADAALISIPQVGADANVTREARATILHHELSHGEYFTNPDYVAFTHRFWTRMLTAGERDRIRHHLGDLGYDTGLEEVMENEAQAYLMFTPDPAFFTPEMIGMSKARLAELRIEFHRAMPAGWLKDSLGQDLNGTTP